MLPEFSTSLRKSWLGFSTRGWHCSTSTPHSPPRNPPFENTLTHTIYIYSRCLNKGATWEAHCQIRPPGTQYLSVIVCGYPNAVSRVSTPTSPFETLWESINHNYFSALACLSLTVSLDWCGVGDIIGIRPKYVYIDHEHIYTCLMLLKRTR